MDLKGVEKYILLMSLAAIPLAGSFPCACVPYVTAQLNPPQIEQPFTSQMSGSEEVPPVDTTASGTAEFNFGSDGIDYKPNVIDISGVTSAHIHSGNVGENGPITVTLLNSDTDTPINQTNGILSQGSISANDLEGPMEGKELSDLVSAMSNGVTYVNIHTEI